MQLLRINKKTSSKIEQAKVLISVYCLLAGIRLSDTERTVLAYLVCYKISQNTKELILKSKLLKNEDSLKNTISKLKKVGLIKKPILNKDYIITDNLNLNLDSVVGLLIKIDNK